MLEWWYYSAGRGLKPQSSNKSLHKKEGDVS